jgi:hypothetical protein
MTLVPLEFCSAIGPLAPVTVPPMEYVGFGPVSSALSSEAESSASKTQAPRLKHSKLPAS